MNAEAEKTYVQHLLAEIKAEIVSEVTAALDTRPLLTLDEAAEALALGRRTVNTLVSEGELRVIELRDGGKLNKTRRIEWSEIDRFKASRRESADDQT